MPHYTFPLVLMQRLLSKLLHEEGLVSQVATYWRFSCFVATNRFVAGLPPLSCSTMNPRGDSLHSLWQNAQEARCSLETTGRALDPNYAPTVSNCIARYTTISSHISALSLFSLNESLEDISTASLQYMVCSAHIASLTLRLPSSSPSERKAIISTARCHYEAFLSLLCSYSLLGSDTAAPGAPSHQALWKSYLENPAAFTTTSSSDPAARRNAKLANYKAERALEHRLQFLLSAPKYVADTAGTGPVDEEAVRDVYLAEIQKAAHEAFQALDGLNQEMQVLAMAPDPEETYDRTRADRDPRRRQQQDGTAGRLAETGDFSERLDLPLRDLTAANKSPLLSNNGKPLRPFTLVASRQEIREGVFRPGHNLPTMSIDEYLAEERRRGNIIEGGGQASLARPEPNEDDMEKADEETYKARAWDEFKEENPRGAGNTLNKG